MPALTEAQRQRQIAIAKQGKAKAKPKPGQKGVPTSGGAKTKAGTIGGANPNTPRPVARVTPKPKPTTYSKAKPGQKGQQTNNKGSGTKSESIGGASPTASAPRPSASSRPQSRFAGQRDRNFQHIQQTGQSLPSAALHSPASGAPIHASPQAFGSAPRLAESAYVGSSAATPARPSTPGQAVRQAAPASETYRDGGKGLYQGTEEYRKAIGGSGNPLLNRFRNQMGLDPATGERLEQLTPEEADLQQQEENPFAGIGDVRGLQIKDTQPRIPQNAEFSAQKTNPQYKGNDEPGKLGQAEDPMRALAELLFKNKLKIQVN
jgi:hypothetical protein